MVFFSPPGQTNTLTVLPVTAFASSVCQHGNCLSSKQYCETQRHNQAVSHIQVGLFPAADSWSSHFPPPLWQYLQLFHKRKIQLHYFCGAGDPHTESTQSAGELGTLWKESFWKTKQILCITWLWVEGITLGVVYLHKILVSFDQLVSRTMCWKVPLLQPPLQLRHRQQVVHHLPQRTPDLAKGTTADVSHFTGYHSQRWAFLSSAVTFVSLIKTSTSHGWWDQPLPLTHVNFRIVTVCVAVFLTLGPGSLGSGVCLFICSYWSCADEMRGKKTR